MTPHHRLPITFVFALTFLSILPATGAGGESSAVTFARRDVERARTLAAAADERAKAAAESPELEAIAAATAAKKSLDALLTRATAEVQAAENGRKAAEAALSTTKDAAAKTMSTADTAAKNLAAATAAKAKAEAHRNAARAAVELAEADLAKATEAGAEAEIATRQLLVQAAKTQLAAAESSLATAIASEQQATVNREAAKSALVAAEQKVAEATKSLETATAGVAAATKTRDEAQALVDQAAKLLEAVQKQAQPAAESKKKADEAAAAAGQRAAAATARLALVEANDAADPKAIHEVSKLTFGRPAIAARVDPTGSHVIVGLQDKTLHRHDILTSDRTSLEGHRTWVRRMAVGGDAELLVSGDYSGTLAWWDPAAPSPKPTRVVLAHEGYVRGVAISPDRQFVASGGNDGFVRVWNGATGELVAEMDGHQSLSKVAEYADTPERVFVNHVYNVAFDPRGRYLVSGDLVGVVKVWEVGTWKSVRDLDAAPLHEYDKTFRAHCGGIRGMDFSPDGKLLAVCGIGEVTNAFAGVGKPTACVFELETGKRLAVLKPAANFQGACWSIRFHPSGEWLVGAGGGGSGSLWFWKPTEEKSFHAFKTPQVAYDVDFHPDGLRMAVALYDKSVRLYDLLPTPKAAAKESTTPATGGN